MYIKDGSKSIGDPYLPPSPPPMVVISSFPGRFVGLVRPLKMYSVTCPFCWGGVGIALYSLAEAQSDLFVIRIIFFLLKSSSSGGQSRPPAVRQNLARTPWGRGLKFEKSTNMTKKKKSKQISKNAEFHADFKSVLKVVEKCTKKLYAKQVWWTCAWDGSKNRKPFL